MIKALYTSATGMKGQQTYIDVIANNLANMNTTSFKRSRVDFHDLLYDERVAPGSQSMEGIEIPTGLQIGSGVTAASTTKVFSPGTPEQTDRDLDVCIKGDGFFQVDMNGTTVYSRDGAFRLNSSRQIVTADGYLLYPPITVASDVVKIHIGQDGTVSGVKADGSVVNSGQITLATFANPSGLKALGSNLFQPTPASSDATQNITPGLSGTGELEQGFLERSNVDVVVELVNMITAQRAYEVNARAIRSTDDMLATTNNMTR
ncbi:MAG TPA: flagellar basal-body rod protein FlgG [Planctomycetota bacterium]|nr:flagellar basal-body rod protein FlgG [Planctomycetota bacterium]